VAGSLSKYFGMRADEDGQKLFWPGTLEGFPLRSPAPPTTTQDEFEKIPLVYDAKVKALQLPRDVEEYQRIIDRCANGWYVLRHERISEYDKEKECYYVLLQWLEIYGETPPEKSFADPNVEVPKPY